MTKQANPEQVQTSIDKLFSFRSKEEILLHLCRAIYVNHESNKSDDATGFTLMILAEYVYKLPEKSSKN